MEWEYVNGLDELTIVVGNEVGSQMRGDENGIGAGDCTNEPENSK